MEFQHVSVLLEETIEGLNIRPNGIYVDGTAGGAGHSSQIAKRLSFEQGGRLIAIDKDPDAIQTATQRLAPYPAAQVVDGDFKDIPQILQRLGIPKVDGILLDLGVSSRQLDTAERGFSYHFDSKLDMRMSQHGLSAYDVVNSYPKEELIRILREYGEEKFAVRIACEIVRAREEKPVETTFELVELIKQAYPAAAKRGKGHPAKQTFQAIRIEVNHELEHLKECIDKSFDCLNVGGRFCIITFHSLEDRIVKQMFASYTVGCTCPPEFPVCVCGKKPRAKLVSRKPIEPTAEEIERNNRCDVGKASAEQSVWVISRAVEDVGAAQQTFHPLGRGVGVQSQVHPVAGKVGLSNRIHHRAVGMIADILDAAGLQIRLHGIGNLIHPVFFTAGVLIKVKLLCGGTEVNFWQGKHPFVSFSLTEYAAQRKKVNKGQTDLVWK